MPLRNRVTPLGELVAEPGRGLVYGNRGCLHDRGGAIVRGYNGKRWIACRLEFRGRRRSPLVQPGRYTGLFFLDEATALSAGHRPCAECRHDDYRRFVELWGTLHPGDRGADAIDARLHAERLVLLARTRRLHEAPMDQLPDGAFVLTPAGPSLVLGKRLLGWSAGGYDSSRPRPRRGQAGVITPPSLLALLGAGWQPAVPLIHPSALERR
jgi:hypothetical protein